MTDLGGLRTRPVGVMTPLLPAMKEEEEEGEDGTTTSSFFIIFVFT